MPRHPDPDLEDRILMAAQTLWRRGGEKALTMRAVSRAAGTNTPAVYRRFKNRKDLVRGLLRNIAFRIRKLFEAGEIEEIAEAYMKYALELPHEYELFYTYAREMNPRRRAGPPPPLREYRPNFAMLEDLLARRFGGAPQDHTQLALAIWSTVHGAATLLLTKTIPDDHAEELRSACRSAVKALLDGAAKFPENN
jgi:AcrR family transcriptional regulator